MSNYKLYPNVQLGSNVQIGEYVIIGLPPKGATEGELTTIIGDNSVIRSHTVIYAGNRIGSHFETGHHVLIRENNEIGAHVSIGTGTCIEHHTKIEENVRIHSQVFIPEYSHLQRNCWIGPNVVLTNAKYPRSREAKERLCGPMIEKGAKIGANSTILPGMKIGANSLVGAGSVVVFNVPEETVVCGNPARIIKTLADIDSYK